MAISFIQTHVFQFLLCVSLDYTQYSTIDIKQQSVASFKWARSLWWDRFITREKLLLAPINVWTESHVLGKQQKGHRWTWALESESLCLESSCSTISYVTLDKLFTSLNHSSLTWKVRIVHSLCFKPLICANKWFLLSWLLRTLSLFLWASQYLYQGHWGRL